MTSQKRLKECFKTLNAISQNVKNASYPVLARNHSSISIFNKLKTLTKCYAADKTPWTVSVTSAPLKAALRGHVRYAGVESADLHNVHRNWRHISHACDEISSRLAR